MPPSLPTDIKDVFGKLTPPPPVDVYTGGSTSTAGLFALISNLLKVSVVVAGLFSLINLLVAGIQYIGSSGKPEVIKQASSKIWMSLLGLVIIASAFVITSLLGLLFYKDATIFLSPILYGPTP